MTRKSKIREKESMSFRKKKKRLARDRRNPRSNPRRTKTKKKTSAYAARIFQTAIGSNAPTKTSVEDLAGITLNAQESQPRPSKSTSWTSPVSTAAHLLKRSRANLPKKDSNPIDNSAILSIFMLQNHPNNSKAFSMWVSKVILNKKSWKFMLISPSA